MGVIRIFSMFSVVILCGSHLFAQDQARKQGALQIATIVVDKANLKAFPKSDSSTVMVVNKGTILPVEFSHKNWIWIITPTGQHAWIKNSDVNLSKMAVPTMGQSMPESKGPRLLDEDRPDQKFPPEDWKEFQFNGLNYYIVPLSVGR